MTTEEFRRDREAQEMKHEREVTWFAGACCVVITIAWARYLVGLFL